jgi:putative peptide zinc metalloprotease protein
VHRPDRVAETRDDGEYQASGIAMNLAEALIQALPELPAQVSTRRKFKFNPALITREELNEKEESVVVVWVPEQQAMYYLDPAQFQLFQLFDGERTFAEVAEEYERITGVAMPEQEVKEFAFSSAETGLFYESAQERNITLSQKLMDERQRRIKKKSKFGDLSHIIFKGWDPNNYLDWLHPKAYWLYSGWFTALTLILFAVMIGMWIERWGEIGHDTLLFYTFTQKTGRDLLEFWLLFLFVGFFHESAHALTAKHFGSEVHNMGFQLIYLTPAFAVEITELWVHAGRLQRFLAIIAGVWIEMIFCGIATIVWSGTPAGTFIHEFSYKIMMITGLVVLIVNLNPFIKLDGYYALAEIVGISELKEQSTAYLSGWVKKNIFRLPVEYDYVPMRRRFLYLPYAFLSGCYSYFLLFAVSRFAYNVFHRFTPEWAFVPAGLLAWTIFKSRIFRLAAFMKTVYLDHRERVWSSLSPRRRMAAAVVLLVVLLVPVFPKTLSAVFVLEPMNKAEVRAQAQGLVEKLNADENSAVTAGMPVAELRNAAIENELDRSRADVEMATGKHAQAEIMYASLASAGTELKRAEHVLADARSRAQQLRIVAPISGTVVTPRVRDLQGAYVEEGTLLMEIADLSTLRARLYVPQYEMRDVSMSAPVSLLFQSFWKPVAGSVKAISSAPAELPSGLAADTRYRGLKPPAFYVVDIQVPNPGQLRIGMSGEAKLFVRRESLLRKGWETLRDFVASRAW